MFAARGALPNRDQIRSPARGEPRMRPRISGAPHASTQTLDRAASARVLRRIRGTEVIGTSYQRAAIGAPQHTSAMRRRVPGVA
jgi:hypothetical protein